jgi:hypothetical protein
MENVLAEETTTLPEGAQISVCRCRVETEKNKFPPFTKLIAYTSRAKLSMRVDDIRPHVMEQYLKLTVREINRLRSALSQKPTVFNESPRDLTEFVDAMAANGMFILE